MRRGGAFLSWRPGRLDAFAACNPAGHLDTVGRRGIGIFIGRQAIHAPEESAVNYWRPAGFGLVVLGVALSVYGLTEFLRMTNAPCAWPSLCLGPDSAITYLIVPGVALALCGVIVLLTAPKKLRPLSPP